MFFELLLSKGNLGNGIGNTFLVTTIFFYIIDGDRVEWMASYYKYISQKTARGHKYIVVSGPSVFP